MAANDTERTALADELRVLECTMHNAAQSGSFLAMRDACYDTEERLRTIRQSVSPATEAFYAALADRLTPAPAAMGREAAWLIECGKSENPSSHPLWWCGSPMRQPDCPWWTSDPHRAVRFARREDAERMIHVVGMGDNASPAFASEHVFVHLRGVR